MKRTQSSRLDLTPAEQTNVRTALRWLRVRCGEWKTVASVLGFAASTVDNVVHTKKAVSPMMAFRVARFAKVPLEDVLSGSFPNPACCPMCGQVKPAEAPEGGEGSK